MESLRPLGLTCETFLKEREGGDGEEGRKEKIKKMRLHTNV
jgi:hypothetical protein